MPLARFTFVLAFAGLAVTLVRLFRRLAPVARGHRILAESRDSSVQQAVPREGEGLDLDLALREKSVTAPRL